MPPTRRIPIAGNDTIIRHPIPVMVRKKMYAIVLIAAIAVCTGCVSTGTYPSFLSATSTYNLHIVPDGPVSNATFCLPLPVKNGTPMIGSRYLSPKDFQKPGYTISFTQAPPEHAYPWNITDTGPFAWFVIIGADNWTPDGYILEITNRNDLSSPRGFLETRMPVGNESVLLPKLNFSAQFPEPEDVPFTTFVRYENSGMVPQTIPVYAVYRSDPGTTVDIDLEIKGYNQWLDGPDQWYDNSYYDSAGIRLKGAGTGWYPGSQRTVDGWFDSAHGTYPDLTRAGWQKLLH